jgi:WD40 repeat protein
MVGSDSAGSVRRFLITIGTSRYGRLDESAYLPHVERDLRVVAELFGRYGYAPAIPGLGAYATAQHVKNALGNWCQDVAIGPTDIVVLYFAGHGITADRHYLLCWDSDDRNLAASALPTEDLIRVLLAGGIRNLLLILDTCYAGAGGADAAVVALRHLGRHLPHGDADAALWFMSSARARDEAGDGSFVAALPTAISAVTGQSGQRQRYLDLHHLVREINADMARSGTGQRAEIVFSRSVDVAPFLPNAMYFPRLPPEGTDLETQRLAAKRDLTEHFGPRSRGVDFESEQGMYFSGRTAVLRRLVAWLATPGGDGRGRVVTGRPGCGKSSVLSRVVVLSDLAYRRGLDLSDADPGTLVPEGIVDVAVHARHKRLDDLVARMAADLKVAADGPGELLREISRRARDGIKTVIVVDALDEAGSGTASDTGARGEPSRIARELLRPLSDIRGVHLLVGTRWEQVRNLGHAVEVLDLDAAELTSEVDVAAYATRMLLAPDEPDLPTPYRGRAELAGTVGAAVARRAAGVYLVARMTARGLRRADEPVDVTVPGWDAKLPSEIGEAFEDYLDRFGADGARVRRLLAPLAFAEGKGLPRDLWPALATAITALACTEEDIEWLRAVAGDYIAEVTEKGRSVFRLYHQTLAEHLRSAQPWPATEVQSRIVAALADSVPGRRTGTPSWFEAHPYVLAHLATHAAAAGCVDGLVRDPGFLLAADQLALLRALEATSGDRERRIRAAFEQVAHRVAEGGLGERAAYLQLSARRCDAVEFADDIDQLRLPMPWSARWAEWSRTGAHRRLLGHTAPVTTVVTGKLDGREIAVSGDNKGSVQVWDLITHKPIGPPLVLGSEDAGVTAIALAEVDDYAVALLGYADGAVRVCDVSTVREHGPPLLGHTNAVTSIAVGGGDAPVVLTGSRDGSLRVWGLRHRRQVGEPITGHRTTINAVALDIVADKTLALTAGDDGEVRVWDLRRREQVGALTGHTGAINAVALGWSEDRVIAASASNDATIVLWDLAIREQLGEPIPAHERGVRAIALGRVDGRTVAVSGGADGLVRLWDVRGRQQIDQPLTGHTDWVSAVCLGAVGERPVAVTGSEDQSVRVWNLAADRPSGGHVKAITVICMDPTAQPPRLVSGSADGTVRLWNVIDRDTPCSVLAGHDGEVTAVTAGRIPGSAVVATGDQRGTVRVWNADRLDDPPVMLPGHTNRVTALHLVQTRDAYLLASGGADGTVALWDLPSASRSGAVLAGHNADVDMLTTCALDGEPAIIAVSRDGYVSLWSLATREPIRLRVPSGDRRIVAVTGLTGRPVTLCQTHGNNLVGWDVLRDEPATAEMVGHTGFVHAATVGRLGGRVVAVTGGNDRSARIWDLTTGTPVTPPLLGHQSPVDAVALGDVDGRPVAVTGDQSGLGTVRLWDASSGEQLGEPVIGHVPDVAAIDVVAGAAGPWLVTGGDDGTVRVRSALVGGETTTRLVGHQRPITAIRSVAVDGRALLASASYDKIIRVWDLDERRELRQLFDPSPDPWSSVQGLAFAIRAGRPVVISGSETGVARVWDVDSGALVGELAGHTARIWSIDVADCDDIGLIATGAGDSTVRLWRLDDLTAVGAPLGGHRGDVDAVAFVELDGRPTVVSGDDGGVLRCWDARTGQARSDSPFTAHPSYITCLRTGTIGDVAILAASSVDGLIRLWRLADHRLLVELNMETTVRDMALSPDGLLCIGTSSGVATIRVHAR